MPPADPAAPPPSARHARFATTQWSVVLDAGSHRDTEGARRALSRLCQTYWYPLYAYVRRRGHSAHDAQDLTQGFFEQVLRRQSLASADPGRGRFRSFILTAMNHFLTSEWKRNSAQKRGGGFADLSLDWASAEQRFDLEPAAATSPDTVFEKQWALALLAEVVNRLEEEYRAGGKEGLFAALRETLQGRSESQPYAELAQTLGLSEGAVKVAVHRLRKRYRELIRFEIAETLAPTEDVETEMRHLLQVLST